jgi:hypothetical membrane protein
MRSVTGWGVLTSAAAPVLLIGGWTLAAALRPDHFDSVKDTISDLAAIDAPHRWVMTSALVGVGAAHIGTALALRPATPAARWLLATGGVATVLVAANPLPGDGGSAPAHALVAGVSFVALGAWPAISWRRRSRVVPGDEAPGAEAVPVIPVPFRPVVALAASGVLLAGLGWFFAELVHDTDRVGLSERAAAGSEALWPLAAVLLARRR